MPFKCRKVFGDGNAFIWQDICRGECQQLPGSDAGIKQDVSRPRPRETEKQLNATENNGTIYAGEQIHRYAKNPKELGDTTHKEKYDDFKAKGVDVHRSLKARH